MCLQLYKSSVWYVEHHVKGLCRISLISAILLGPNDWFLNEVSLLAGKNTPLALNRLFHAEWMSDEWVSIYCNIQIHLTVTAFKCELENEAHALHSNSIFDHNAVKLTLTAFCAHLTSKTWKDLQNCCRYYLFSDSTLKYKTKHITSVKHLNVSSDIFDHWQSCDQVRQHLICTLQIHTNLHACFKAFLLIYC